MEARIAELEERLRELTLGVKTKDLSLAALVDHEQRRTRVESADDDSTPLSATKATLGSAKLSDTEMGREN